MILFHSNFTKFENKYLGNQRESSFEVDGPGIFNLAVFSGDFSQLSENSLIVGTGEVTGLPITTGLIEHGSRV